LQLKNIHPAFVTLHVGAGTFKPVKSETLDEHEMHAEFIDVSLAFIQQLIEYYGKNIIAVGTTSLRTIESLYWIGRKAVQQQLSLSVPGLLVSQWEPYTPHGADISVKEALEKLVEEMKKNNLTRLIGKTQILITPGYEFRIIKGLITNFHQPQSTLLLLVAALVGEKWKTIYDHALEHDFRFLSYGDGCLLWKD
jgi:S-adenosylmethionine:tRNA ribosyltransferase-isomerase